MYIHLGQGAVTRSRDVVAVFDLDTSTISKITRDFLKKAEQDGSVCYDSFDLPKSFVVCCEPGKKENKIHLSLLSVGTLQKRAETVSGGKGEKLRETLE